MRIPGFEMLEKLGEGGMATVWKARQVSLDRIVAVKILSTRLTSDTTDVKMFLNEAQATAKLKHPGIIQVYDANVLGGVYYYIMEYVAGYTVGDWLRRKGTLSEKDALAVAECVADALCYAWEKERIIHCDIKPDNIIIDSDGAVKISDLGLARTVSAMGGGDGLLDQVMGTACFMSPEQVMGIADLDCRTDIYSLGAMLYYLVTGKMLFEGYSDDRAMEMQLRETVPDPLDINPDLYKSTCWLIEKMLMKDRNLRHDDWRAVLADIARAKGRLPPQGSPPPEGKSTTRRSKERSKQDYHTTSGAPPGGEKTGSPVAKSAIAAVVIGLIVAVFLFFGRPDKPPRPPGQTMTTGNTQTPPAGAQRQDQSADKNAREMFEFAHKWAAENPGQYQQIIRRYHNVMSQTKGTKYFLMAEDQIRKAKAAQKAAISDLLKTLDMEASGLISNNEFAQAATIYETYSGALAAETEPIRKAAAMELMKRQKEHEKLLVDNQRKSEEAYATALDTTVSALCTGTLAQARDIMANALSDDSLIEKRDTLKAVNRLLDDTAGLEEKILGTFRNQSGKETAVELASGVKKLTVLEIADKKITATQKLNAQGASMVLTFGVNDLSAKEKLLRMGPEDSPEAALARGMIAINSRAYPHARKYFTMTAPVIAGKLVAYVDQLEQKSISEDAERQLNQILRSVGINVGPYDRDAWISAINSKKFPAGNSEMTAMLTAALANFRAKHGATDFAKEAETVMDAIQQAVSRNGGETQETGARATAVSIPPEVLAVKGNTKAALELFLKKNPMMTEQQIRIETDLEGQACGMDIQGRNLGNLWPVAALPNLKTLSCINQDAEPNMLNDLQPLRGLPLEMLVIHNSRISDLSPLKQMPLRSLNLSQNSLVKDLQPLRGIPLQFLVLQSSKVSDLSPLKSMPLRYLDLTQNPSVKDISILRGMKLDFLSLNGTRLFDVLPLSGMPLKTLLINGTQVKDLAALKGMPLEHLELADTSIRDFSFLQELKQLRSLNLSGTQFKNLKLLATLPLDVLILNGSSVTDLSPMKGMLLKRLDIERIAVKDFSVLKSLPLLIELDLNGSRLSDLNMIAGLNLANLSLAETAVSDLSPLKGMQLKQLNIEGARVSDLSPLQGMPLEHLACRRIATKNYTPLKGMPIKRIYIDAPFDKTSLTNLLPQLQFINE